MKIIEPTFEMLRPGNAAEGVEMLRFIEQMARISHRSEERQTTDTWERFIRAVVLEKGDWSVVEHATATVIFRVDRGVTHELVRHRLFSYTQESTRFVNYGKREMEFIQPTGLEQYEAQFILSCADAEQSYKKLLVGTSPQIARSVLPNALASTIAVTGNLRNWRHFLIMRTSRETHPDFRRVTIPLLKVFQDRIPLLFDDIIPNERQIDAMSKPR